MIRKKISIPSKTPTLTRERKEIDISSLIPSPSVPFNLECSSKKEGAFQLGKITNVIGDSHAGKTLFVLSMLAECSKQKRFDDYRFVYDDVESANEFDMPYMFGKNCSTRIEKDALSSETIEEFGDNVSRLIEDGDPFIYVLDSFDALTSEAEQELDEENRKKREKGNEVKGSYGDGKAKVFSSFCRKKANLLYKNKSALIVISQTRDNIGFGAQFTPKIRSGGRALKFYSCHEVWLAIKKREKKGTRTHYTDVIAKIEKNKVTGRHSETYFPIIFDYGIDNIAACVDFLIREKHWTNTKTDIHTNGFHPAEKVKYAELVKYIEDNGLEDALADVCQICYDEVIKGMVPKRKPRF
jgi:RecA/RadA recombinase